MDITTGTRVELTDGPAAGWQGTVRDRKDSPGRAEAYVEWDHGEAWTWTDTDRLAVIEDSPMDRIIREAEARRDEERCPTCGHEHEPDPLTERAERYIDSAQMAFENALDSDGFFIVTVARKPHPDNPEITLLVPTAIGDCLHDFAADVIEAQISYLAAMQHQAMVSEKLNRKYGDEPGR